MRNGWVVAALLAVGAAFLFRPARGDEAKATADEKKPNVEVAVPARKVIYRKLDVPGEILADQQAAIYSRVQGYIDAVNVDRGSTVQASDVLVKIAIPEVEKKLARQKAELELCAPTEARDKATFDWRESAVKRLESLKARSPDLVNAEQLDEAHGRCEVAKQELEITRRKKAVMEAEIAETQATIDLATIRAPMSGIITERWADRGDFAQAGTTKLLHLMKTDPVRVRIAVPQTEVPFIRPDSLAKITLAELPSFSKEAKASRLFWALNRSTKTMYAEIDIPNPDLAIRPGMYARVRADLEEHKDAMVLPAASLVVEKTKTSVFVVKDGVAKKIEIKVGLDDGIEFEVKSGLDPADLVIVNGKNLVSDGMAVRTVLKELK